MKKDLNIMEQGGFDLVELPEQESEPMVSVSMSHLRELTAIDTKVGRVGYLHVCKEGEVGDAAERREGADRHGHHRARTADD